MSNRVSLVARGVVFLGLSVVLAAPGEVAAQRLSAVLEMSCYPTAEDPRPAPPCLLPEGLDERFVSPRPSGRLRLAVRNDDTVRMVINLRGLAPDLVVTAWLAYFFPPGPAPDPIFEPAGEGLPPVAGVSVPLAPTWASYSEGMGYDPNRFIPLNATQSRLEVLLDFNPLKVDQGPLRNALSHTLQAAAPAGTEAEQGLCCPEGAPAAQPQPIGSSLLRRFDPQTGFVVLDAEGSPELVRSPVAADFIAIVVHLDDTTHGINPGIPIFPVPGIRADTGDHFLLGLFDLRDFQME